LAFLFVGGEKKVNPMKRNKADTPEEVPLILQDTMQRLDTYPKGIKALFNAVSQCLQLACIYMQ
jgi:hypothetical protein